MPLPLLPDAWRHFLGFAGYDYIAEMDRELRYLDVSANYEQLLGRPRAEIVGRTAFELQVIHPDDLAGLQLGLRPLFEQDVPVRVEYRFRAASGAWLWAESSGQAFLNSSGEWRCLFISRDVTARKEAEASLAASEADYRALIEHAVDAILIGNSRGEIIRANARAFALTGYEPDELLGMSIAGLFATETRERVPLRYDLLDRGEDVRSERMLLRKDGVQVPIEMNTRRIPDGRYQTFVRDISERRSSVDALRASEERYRLVFEGTSIGIFHFDTQGRVLLCNEAFARQMGVARENIVGFDMLANLRNEDVLRAMDVAMRGGRGHYSGQYTSVTGGKTSYLRLETSGLFSSDGRPVGAMGIVEDLTAQRAAEQELAKAQSILRAALDQTSAGILIASAHNGRIELANRAAEEILMQDRESLNRIFSDPNAWNQWSCRRADGSLCPLAEIPILRAMTHGETASNVELRISKGNASERWVSVSASPVMDDSGRIAASVSVIADITERKRVEEALRQAQKLESLGVLAGGIAHDFNNLLTAILGNLNLAQLVVSPESPAQPYLDAVEKIVLKAAELTRQMLAYSGKGRFIIRSHDVNGVVREMAHLLGVSISKKATLRLELEPEIIPFEADVAQIQQVILNLVINASDALGDRDGAITICTRVAALDPETIAATFPGQHLQPGRFVVLEVSDTGCGITPEVMDRLFDPFFTTKLQGRGLGLSALLGILRGHHAGYEIRSEPGRGTTFTLYFPAGSGCAEASPAPPARATSRLRGTILLVDDESAILSTISPALEHFGFNVMTARDGMEAVEVFRRDPSAVDLVLMDVTMPRMDGKQAFRALRELRADTPVILSSGYHELESVQKLREEGLAAFIQKPYQLEELRRVLSLCLRR